MVISQEVILWLTRESAVLATETILPVARVPKNMTERWEDRIILRASGTGGTRDEIEQDDA